jgi:hypothetical protein
MADPTRTDGSGGDDSLQIQFRADQPVTARSALVDTLHRSFEKPPPTWRAGTTRKIALIGAGPTINLAPWFDPSWEIWCHATCATLASRADRYFDQHPWEWILSKNAPGYLSWLKRTREPIYMADRRKDDVPSSVRYPLERLRAEFPYPFGSHAAYMVALALTEGVTHLGFFGIHYAIDSEWKDQRPNAEFWAGLAAGRGINLVIPAESPFCHEPKELYAYETHRGPDAQKRWSRRLVHRLDAHLEGGTKITERTADELAANERPDMTLKKNHANIARQMAGLPPLLPNGQPAW